jgi:hypothetical protein
VFLWELYTLGEQPRSHCTTYTEVKEEVLANRLLPRPESPVRFHCPDDMCVNVNGLE